MIDELNACTLCIWFLAQRQPPGLGDRKFSGQGLCEGDIPLTQPSLESSTHPQHPVYWEMFVTPAGYRTLMLRFGCQLSASLYDPGMQLIICAAV